MTAVARARRTLARWLRVVGVLGALLIVSGPAVFGCAFGQLGAVDEHLCKCGMAPGKCGCPECAQIELQRHRAHAPERLPALKDGCSRDAPAIAFAGSLEALPSQSSARLPIPGGELRPAPASPLAPANPPSRPPTPPPRLASV